MADTAERRLPRSAPAVRWAAAIVIVQGALLTTGALAFGAWLAVTRPDNVGFPAGTAVIVLLLGLVLLLGGRALAGGARPSVSPILLVELLMLPVAWSMGQARQWPVCAALAVPALAVLGLLATPAGRAVMRGEG
ncbi:MAG: hypothetical protein ACJ74O_04360 [Frankiaceae bacterium]